MKIKCIIFDFDGVILNSHNVKTDAFEKIFSKYGKSIGKKAKNYHLKNVGKSRYLKFKYILNNVLKYKSTKKIHVLVIPKGKYIDLDDFSQNASPEEMVGLLKGINTVAKKLNISVDTGKGYRALANISEDGGQEVPHLHFHLFGGEKIGKMVT